MEMNVSTVEEQVVARKKGGVNPIFILPILYAIGASIYVFILVIRITLKLLRVLKE